MQGGVGVIDQDTSGADVARSQGVLVLVLVLVLVCWDRSRACKYWRGRTEER
jgi:hypothetical protein